MQLGKEPDFGEGLAVDVFLSVSFVLWLLVGNRGLVRCRAYLLKLRSLLPRRTMYSFSSGKVELVSI